MNYDDLPKELRSKVDAALGRQPKASKDRRSVTGPSLALRCLSCGFLVDPATEGRLRRHQDENRTHGRYEHRFTAPSPSRTNGEPA